MISLQIKMSLVTRKFIILEDVPHYNNLHAIRI